jgi:hypothetical protein
MKKHKWDAQADQYLHTRETYRLQKGKMNVRRHELRHFNTTNLTFSTDLTSLMCSGVQTIKEKHLFREMPVEGVERSYVTSLSSMLRSWAKMHHAQTF